MEDSVMQDTVLVIDGVAALIARYPAGESSFGESGTLIKADPNTVAPGMLWDGATFTDPPPPAP